MLKLVAIAVLGFMGAAAALFGGAFGYYFLQNRFFYSAHPIVADLPPDDAQSSKTSEKRLLADFPIGSPAPRMSDYLLSQGFGVVAARAHALQLTKLGRLTDLARKDWIVVWQEDARGNLTEIAASYHRSMS